MTISEAPTLLDTNVLVYAADQLSPFHDVCRKLREDGRTGKRNLCITPQVLFEFYAVVTDPKRVRDPLDPSEAIAEISAYLDDPAIKTIHQTPEATGRVTDLAERYAIRRQEIFDALIVATMLSNDVRQIYTYDVGHFSQYPEIQVLKPE